MEREWFIMDYVNPITLPPMGKRVLLANPEAGVLGAGTLKGVTEQGAPAFAEQVIETTDRYCGQPFTWSHWAHLPALPDLAPAGGYAYIVTLDYHDPGESGYIRLTMPELAEVVGEGVNLHDVMDDDDYDWDGFWERLEPYEDRKRPGEPPVSRYGDNYYEFPIV